MRYSIGKIESTRRELSEWPSLSEMARRYTTSYSTRPSLYSPTSSTSRSSSLSTFSSKPTYAEFYLRTKKSGSLAIPTSEYTSKQRAELRELFDLYDLDRDGFLGKDDLMKLYGTIDSNLATEAKVDRLILSATEEEEGKIDIEQFVNFIGSTYFGTFSRIELRYSFDLLDKDGDGYLSASDLKSSFDALGWSKRFDLKKMLERMDRSGRGLVSFDDFKSAMLSPLTE